jgi:hypothetical protein
MPRLAKRLLLPVLVAAIAGGAAISPAAAGRATLSKGDRTALKQAISTCKAEAKGKKIKWLQRRKYVNGCVTEALRDRPNINVIQILKDHPEMRDLPMDNWDSI